MGPKKWPNMEYLLNWMHFSKKCIGKFGSYCTQLTKSHPCKYPIFGHFGHFWPHNPNFDQIYNFTSYLGQRQLISWSKTVPFRTPKTQNWSSPIMITDGKKSMVNGKGQFFGFFFTWPFALEAVVEEPVTRKCVRLEDWRPSFRTFPLQTITPPS